VAGSGFAVLDLETTGLFPGGNDRIIEVAVVQLSDSGRVQGRWETLVDPGRDLGRSDLHRIRAADVRDAPAFAEIAPRLIDLLRGRVLVAHHASLATRFLLAELRRAGLGPMGEPVTLCTMQLARDFLPGAGRSLVECCAALDIELDGAHSAGVDALATARLFAAFIEAADAPEFWDAHLDAAARQPWPAAPTPAASTSAADWSPRTVSPHPLAMPGFLERLTARLPDVAGPTEYVDYLALVDRCLLDRTLSAHEAHSLVRLAEDVGLDQNTCAALHRTYFAALTDLAWSDGILTGSELADLVSVGTLLSQPTGIIAAALDERRHQTSSPIGPAAGPGIDLRPGDLVVLTGAMSRPRSAWERDLRARGFVPWPAVTRKVTLLVAADTDSLSGKARKARDYGIPIIDESALAGFCGA
jgi:DNA polymerase-3 subunit epsilon